MIINQNMDKMAVNKKANSCLSMGKISLKISHFFNQEIHKDFKLKF